jgi:competence protein ComEA
MQAIVTALTVGAFSVLAAGAAPVPEVPSESPGREVQDERRVDLNTASAAELETIPGIGPAMAQRILEWRRDHGPFVHVEDLLNVRGIGTKTLEKLRPFVRIGDATRLRR